MSKQLNVALIGNPNTGKTSVFNALTGLNQKVGNYPGITVDKKQGVCKTILTKIPKGLQSSFLLGIFNLGLECYGKKVII